MLIDCTLGAGLDSKYRSIYNTEKGMLIRMCN